MVLCLRRQWIELRLLHRLLLLYVLLEHLRVVVHVGVARGVELVVLRVLPVESHPLVVLLYLHQVTFVLVHLVKILVPLLPVRRHIHLITN